MFLEGLHAHHVRMPGWGMPQFGVRMAVQSRDAEVRMRWEEPDLWVQRLLPVPDADVRQEWDQLCILPQVVRQSWPKLCVQWDQLALLLQ